MPTEQEQTETFLKTNGPPPEILEPDIPAHLLFGKSESERWLYEKIDVAHKQNCWLMEQVVGLKQAHRTLQKHMSAADEKFEQVEKATKKALDAHDKEDDERFARVEGSLATFSALRDKWLTRKKMALHLFVAGFTIFLLPALSVLAAEVLKPWVSKLLGIHP